jgi:aspartate-semialdehyde dehydrogenase
VRVAVVGATGAVGRQFVSILEERSFPVDELVLLASERSAGMRIPFRGRDLTVQALSDQGLGGVHLALLSAGGDVSRRMVPSAAESGTVCVDNSSAFRMHPDVPLVIPEVNGQVLDADPRPRIIANPNCTAIAVVMAVGPLHRVAGLTSLIVSSYQSVSGTGMKGVRELVEQVEKLHGQEEELSHPERGALPIGEVFPRTIAYNVIPQCDQFVDGWTIEERKLAAESRKILDLPELRVAATAVRVPVVVGHSVSIHATFSGPLSPADARRVLAEAPGIRLVDDPERGEYPTPLDVAGIDDVLVGRIRQPEGEPNTLLLFACDDNLRKGAALNAVQIAERLYAS